MRELIEARECELLYLPPYSPNLNPIEEAFAKVKALLGRAGARAHEGLVEAIGRALDRGHGPGRSRLLRALGYRPQVNHRGGPQRTAAGLE